MAAILGLTWKVMGSCQLSQLTEEKLLPVAFVSLLTLNIACGWNQGLSPFHILLLGIGFAHALGIRPEGTTVWGIVKLICLSVSSSGTSR